MRIVKTARYAALSFIVLLCEMTFSKYIEISGVVPMLSFSFLITAAMFEEDVNCILIVSAVLGGMLDVLSDHGFGTYAVAFTLSAAAAFFIRDKLFSSKVLLLVFCSFLLSIFTQVVYYLFHIIDIGGNFFAGFTSVVVPTGVYNTFVSLIFYPVLKKILLKRR